MTAALPAAGTRPAVYPAPGPVDPGGGGRGRPGRVLNSPTALRALLAGLVLLSLAWGAFGGWVADQHSSAADAVGTTDQRLSLEARQMYSSLADADATITAALLASRQPPLGQLQRYENDLATATTELPRLQAAPGNQATSAALARVNAGLSGYTGYVAAAQSEYAMGYSLTGGSFLQVASEEAHLVLLPSANTVFTQENAALSAASAQASGLPTVIAALVLAVLTAVAFYRAQRWLARRTNRVLSPGLVLASLLLAISVIWVFVAFLTARSDLDGGIANGSGPAQNLALADIGVQRIRGDAVLNVISRSGTASFQDDFLATSRKVGPGNGSLLSDAAAAQQGGGPGTALVATAERDATSWYAANNQVYQLGIAADYAAERNLVVGTSAGSSAASYTALDGHLTQAIGADQAVFESAATNGANALDPLEGVVIASSVLMAIGCGWAVSRRLAEYR